MLHELHYISPEHRSLELAGFTKSIGFSMRCSSHSPEDFLKRFSRRNLLVFVDGESAGAFTESEWQPLLTAYQRPRLVVYCEKGPILPFLAGDGVFRPGDRDALQETLRTLLNVAFIARMRRYFNSIERFNARSPAGSLDALQKGVPVIGPSGRILYGNAFAGQSTGAYGIASVGRSMYPEGVQYCDCNGRILTKAGYPPFVAIQTGIHARLRLERLLSTMPALIYVVDVGQGRSLNRQLESYPWYIPADVEAGDLLISIMKQEDRDKFVEARTAIPTEQRTRYRLRDFLTKQLQDFVNVEDRQRATQFFLMLLRGERYEPFEARIRIKYGNIRHALISSSFIKGAGGGNRYKLTALKDITEFQSLQDKLAERGHMDLPGSMAGCIAHDFNNILQWLSNFNCLIPMELGNLEIGGKTSERLKGSVANHRRLIEREADITGQVLEFSRQNELSPMLLNPGAEIRDFLDIFTNQLSDRIRLERSLPDTALYTIGNRVAFQRLLQNLFCNLLKALEDTDEKILRIALDRGLLESRPPGAIVDIPPREYACLFFYDTGALIAEENRPGIFEPFYSHRPENPGMRPRLVSVYSTVCRLNGSPAVRTRVAEFTEFVFYFPLTQEQDVPS